LTVIPQLGAYPPLGRPVAHLQALFTVNPVHPFMVYLPSFTLQQGMNPFITVSNSCDSNIFYLFAEQGLVIFP
jgi:hypothetical protein